eukprot:g52100.t1
MTGNRFSGLLPRIILMGRSIAASSLDIRLPLLLLTPLQPLPKARLLQLRIAPAGESKSTDEPDPWKAAANRKSALRRTQERVVDLLLDASLLEEEQTLVAHRIALLETCLACTCSDCRSGERKRLADRPKDQYGNMGDALSQFDGLYKSLWNKAQVSEQEDGGQEGAVEDCLWVSTSLQ